MCSMTIIGDWITVPESPVVVVRHPLHQVKDRPWQAAYGTVPVVSYPHVQVSSVEVLEILIKRHEILRAKSKHQQPHSKPVPGPRMSRLSKQKNKKNNQRQKYIKKDLKKDCHFLNKLQQLVIDFLKIDFLCLKL